MEILDNNLGQNQPVDENDRQLAALAHGLGILFFWTAWYGLVATVVFYALTRDRKDFLRHHAAEAVNFQLTIWLYIAILFAISFGATIFLGVTALANPLVAGVGFAGGITFWGVLTTIFPICAFILMIFACIRAFNGDNWRYPFTIRVVG